MYAPNGRGGDEDDPAVIEESGSLQGPRRLSVWQVEHDHRLPATPHVLGHILDGDAPLVGHFFDLAKIHGDIGVRRSRDTSSQAVLVFLCEPPPGDNVGTRLRASERSMTAMPSILHERVCYAVRRTGEGR
jgi:hypothetical protein